MMLDFFRKVPTDLTEATIVLFDGVSKVYRLELFDRSVLLFRS